MKKCELLLEEKMENALEKIVFSNSPIGRENGKCTRKNDHQTIDSQEVFW